MNKNLACLMGGHTPSGILNASHNFTRNTCLYCNEPLYYVGDIMSDVEGSWKTKEEMDKTNDRPTGFDPDYP